MTIDDHVVFRVLEASEMMKSCNDVVGDVDTKMIIVQFTIL